MGAIANETRIRELMDSAEDDGEQMQESIELATLELKEILLRIASRPGGAQETGRAVAYIHCWIQELNDGKA